MMNLALVTVLKSTYSMRAQFSNKLDQLTIEKLFIISFKMVVIMRTDHLVS